MFSDLETDYLNPIDFCNRMNQVRTPCLVEVPLVLSAIQFVMPEIIAHVIITTVFLLCGQWRSVLFNAPLLAVNINK